MRILNVVNTVFELYYLSSAGYLLKLCMPDTKLRLLVTPLVAAKLSHELKSLYSDIQVTEFPRISGKPAQDIAKGLRFYRRLRQLNFDVDIICISSWREYFANILCRYLANGPRLVALRMCDHRCDYLCCARKPLRAAYNNVLNRLFGASTMEYRWHKATALTESRLYTRNPFYRTICISDWGHKQAGSEFRLPPPFIALRQLYDHKKDEDISQKAPILVIGERTPLFESWGAEAQSLYESIFEFLKWNFTECKLLFKPHAGLTDIDTIKLSGFDIIPADISVEELCLRNKYSRVISVKSTACKVAAYCGQPAYVLYPMFKFSNDLKESLNAYTEDMRSVIKVTDLSQLIPQPPPPLAFDIEKMSSEYRQAIAG